MPPSACMAPSRCIGRETTACAVASDLAQPGDEIVLHNQGVVKANLVPRRGVGRHGAQPLTSPRLGAPRRPAPLPAVLRAPPEGPLDRESTGRNQDIPDAVSLLRHSHLDGVPRLTDLHLDAYTPSSPPKRVRLGTPDTA